MRLTSLLVIMSISCAVLSQTACPNNHYLDILRTKNLPMYSEPQKTTTICAFEFGTYGSCCNYWTIQSVATEDNRVIDQAVGRVVTEFTYLNGFLNNYARKVKELAFLPEVVEPYGVGYRNTVIRAAKQFIESYTTK